MDFHVSDGGYSGALDVEFFGGVLDGIRDSIKIIDRSYTLVYANKAGLEAIGKPLDQVVGKGQKCFEEFYNSERQCSFCIIEQVLKSGLPAFHTFRETDDRQRTKVKEISAFPLTDNNGHVEFIVEIVRDVTGLKNEISAAEEFSEIISRDKAMKPVFELMESVAPTDSTVLIYGETGSGKELVARAIHRVSRRSTKKFVAVNCGALSDTLLETELFGHEKGAFTGADKRRIGRFELAHGGVLFLDEIGDISPAMQVKILRALQEGEVTRVGGMETIKVDVRIICATNVDLLEAVRDGRFREDLYYRVNVVPITIPSLHERREDIEPLAVHYLEKFARDIGKNFTGFSAQVMETMKHYRWPGNVRELRNLVERAVILNKGPIVMRIDIHDLHSEGSAPGQVAEEGTLKEAAELAEKKYLIEAIRANKGNIGQTAQQAGVNMRTINRKMIQFAIKKEDYK